MNHELEQTDAQNRLKDIEFALNESSIVAITDEKGIIQFANDKFCEISKYSREELIGSTHMTVNSGYHSREFMKYLWRTISQGDVWQGQIKNKAKDGAYYWVDTTIVPFFKDSSKPYQYISIRHDITVQKQYEKTIEHMAFFDPLTSLPNRNSLNKWVKEHLSMRDNKIAVLFIDLDRFKSINDNFGHNTGDLVINEVGKRLNIILDQSVFISRLGGDEFIVVLEDVQSDEHIISIVTNMINQLALPYYINTQQITTTVSVGICIDPISTDKWKSPIYIEKLIKQANFARNHAKKLGGNTYYFNTTNQNLEIERYYQIEQELLHALDLNQFSIVYQPIIHLNTNKIVGVEALLRWHNPTLGAVTPLEFIPILEDLGHIISVGKWVLRSVCNQMKSWQDSGLIMQKATVNVSPIQFRTKDFVSDVEQILADTQLDAHLIELEITEGTLLNIGDAMKTLRELKKIGVKIAIDDFGTGYSSLSYLKNLPIDTLKIDKSFINDLDVDGEFIVDTIINMGANLNFTIIAEGIENKEQLEYLKKQACPEGQGYYFSRPIQSKDIPKLTHFIK